MIPSCHPRHNHSILGITNVHADCVSVSGSSCDATNAQMTIPERSGADEFDGDESFHSAESGDYPYSDIGFSGNGSDDGGDASCRLTSKRDRFEAAQDAAKDERDNAKRRRRATKQFVLNAGPGP